MFTGIITDIGTVCSVTADGDTRLVISTSYATESVSIGASVACSGACLTVVEKGSGWLAFDVSAETLACTILGSWRGGSSVNLERALRAGDELGGHILTGHVDGVIKLRDRRAEGDSLRLQFELDPWLAPYVVSKGAIALDGVSLTINEATESHFGVNIIPHTQRATTLGEISPGARVNVEIDILARYVGRAVSALTVREET